MQEFETLRNVLAIDKLNQSDNSNRSLFESVAVPEVLAALAAWKQSSGSVGVLIGGLALSFYVKPRQTMGIDLLYLSDQDIPDSVEGFKKIRSHAFQHNETHIEIEVLSPEFLGVNKQLISKVLSNSRTSDGITFPSKSGLVALKLQRENLQDQADIGALIQSGDVDLLLYVEWLSTEQKTMFFDIKSKVQR